MAERPPIRPPAPQRDESADARQGLGRFVKDAKSAHAEVSKNALLVGALFGSDGAASLAIATNALGTVGSAAVYAAKQVYSAFSDIFSQFSANIGRLSSTSQAIGNVPIQQLQGLEFAAGRAGVGADALKTTLVDLQNKMYGTTVGNVEAILGFSRLGVSIYKAGGGFKAANVLLEESVEKLIGIQDPAVRTGKALASVGQAGLDLANYFADKGIQAFRDYQKAVKDFGAQLADEDISAVKEYRFQIGHLGLVMEGLKNSIGGPLAQIFAPLTKQFSEWSQGKAKGTNAVLRDSVGHFTKLGPVVLKLAQYAYQLVPVFGFVIEVLAAVGNVVGTVLVGAIETLTAVGSNLGSVLIPIALGIFAAFFKIPALFALIFLLIEDLIVFAQGGDSLFGDALAAFEKWRTEFIKPNPDDPWWLAALRFALRLITKDIPDAFREHFIPNFQKASGFFEGLAAKVEKVTGKGALTTLIRNPLAPFDPNESLTVDTLRGFGLLGGVDAIRGANAGVPTTPVFTPQFTAGLSAQAGAALAGLPGLTINVTGSLGSLKEVQEAVKKTGAELIGEFSDSLISGLGR